ncbi:BatB [hydrothermal vent metagenome]|uniref:BatB n=1 Tax=hydrothermal vent metagenome TaxID=652676 RepID=A0A1W1EFR2_9ZZZZ
MSILYPLFLWLLIPLALLYWKSKSWQLQNIVHGLVLALIIVTLSRPVIKQGIEESKIEARDIIIALDVSYSMRAKDISPSRYTFAKRTIESLLSRYPKDNVMLIAFTSNPLLLSPPTTDHALILTALNTLNPEYILTKGTSLKKLFAKLKTMHSENKDFILITDGGEEHNTELLAKTLKSTQVHLSILALGSTSGSTIENPDGTLVKDKEDHLIVSRINPMLKALAEAVQGSYLTPSSSPEATATALHKSIEAQTRDSQEISKKQHTYTELYYIPLLLALILFFLVHTRASRVLIVLFALLGLEVQASVLDGYYLNQAAKSYEEKDFNQSKILLKKIETDSLESQLILANSYYKLASYKKAIAIYSSIRSTNPSIKQMLYYNIANAYTQLHTYDKAKIYYTKALQLGKDADALHNLSLIALLKKNKDKGLGISHPKSQNSSASKNQSPEKDDDKKDDDKKESREEDQPSSGSGSGGESKQEKADKNDKKRLKMDPSAEVQPLSSKVYELINKGYIRETRPW